MTPHTPTTLFTLPLELRHEIYSYFAPPHGIHLSFHNVSLRLSECVQPRPNISQSMDKRRYLFNTSHATPDPVFARRVASTWGPHWKCEELANMEEECQKKMPLVWTQVSHQMLTDVLAYIIEMTTVYVTDLGTLQQLVTPKSTLVPNYLGPVLAHVKHLSITLRLSLDTFREIEALYTLIQTPQKSRAPSKKRKAASNRRKNRPEWRRAAHPPVWPAMCPSLAHLKSLQKLEIWADHDSKSSWSVVHERAFLAPLESLFDDEVTVTYHLPKLHPRYEDDERHYTSTGVVTSFSIVRNMRQFWRAAFEDGRMFMKIKRDFPVYLHTYEYDGDDDDDSDDNDNTDARSDSFSAEFQEQYKEHEEKAEAYERKLWEQGTDVDDLCELEELPYYWAPAPKVPDRGMPDRSMHFDDSSDDEWYSRRVQPLKDPSSDESESEELGHGKYNGRGMYAAQGLRSMGKAKSRARRRGR